MSNEKTVANIHDVTALMAPYLDSHQLLRMVDFQININQESKIYDKQSLEHERLKILKRLNTYDKAWQQECIIRRIPEDTEMNDEYKQKEEQFDDALDDLAHKIDEVKTKLTSEEAQQLLTQGKDNNRLWVALKEDCGFNEEDLTNLFKYARMLYNCEEYEEGESILYIYKLIAPYDHSMHLSALWGDIANCIQLMDDDSKTNESFERAVTTMNDLKDTIEKSKEENPLKTLQQRAWLLHWALFIYFSKPAKVNQLAVKTNENSTKCTEHLIHLCLFNQGDKEENHYKNTIETICPWMLRYLAVIIITSDTIDKKDNKLRRLVEIIDQEQINYSDPITNFLLSLRKNCDFEAAQSYLEKCHQVLKSDYFVRDYADAFLEKGKHLIFEMVCRIHKCIRLESIAEKLNMTQEDAELWIVDLIRNYRLHAKIDGENGNIILGQDPVLPYQQIIQRTSTLSVASKMLLKNLETRINQQKERRSNDIPSWAKQDPSGNANRSPRKY